MFVKYPSSSTELFLGKISFLDSLPIAINFLPHFVNKILPKIKLDKKVKKEFQLSIPVKKIEATDDPVKSYLNTIAFHSLLKKSEEVDVASKLSIAKNRAEKVELLEVTIAAKAGEEGKLLKISMQLEKLLVSVLLLGMLMLMVWVLHQHSPMEDY